MANKFVDNNGLLYFWTKIVSLFVKKDGNKVLSDNNYTTAEKDKLAGLNNYTLPTASSTALGGVKVGAGLTISSGVLSASTKISQLSNDSGFQTAENVQTAINAATTDMATKTYVTQQLANINKKQIVTSTSEMTDANTIYLLANEGTGSNVYDEYIVVNGKAEKVGSTDVDLTNYVKTSDLVAITNEEIDVIVASE